MIKHIVMFQFSDRVTNENRSQMEALITASANTLSNQIPGLITCTLHFNRFPSTHHVMMYCEFVDEEALQVFQTHPLHIAHRERTKDYVTNRAVIDY